jgi:hypothetical protein
VVRSEASQWPRAAADCRFIAVLAVESGDRAVIYRVTARYIEKKAPDFYEKLTDGSIEGQRPDGREILSSMKRAKIIEPAIIRWYETCFCATPLKHERETVYDRYLEDISTTPAEAYGDVAGQPFWSYLERAGTR